MHFFVFACFNLVVWRMPILRRVSSMLISARMKIYQLRATHWHIYNMHFFPVHSTHDSRLIRNWRSINKRAKTPKEFRRLIPFSWNKIRTRPFSTQINQIRSINLYTLGIRCGFRDRSNGGSWCEIVVSYNLRKPRDCGRDFLPIENRLCWIECDETVDSLVCQRQLPIIQSNPNIYSSLGLSHQS